MVPRKPWVSEKFSSISESRQRFYKVSEAHFFSCLGQKSLESQARIFKQGSRRVSDFTIHHPLNSTINFEIHVHVPHDHDPLPPHISKKMQIKIVPFTQLSLPGSVKFLNIKNRPYCIVLICRIGYMQMRVLKREIKRDLSREVGECCIR